MIPFNKLLEYSPLTCVACGVTKGNISFVRGSSSQLHRRDQVLVAQAIRKYMNQYSIPQREVVEKTNLNQSHLSQHFTHGVTMKASKRIKLYHWFEDDQKQRTGSKCVSVWGGGGGESMCMHVHIFHFVLS